VLAAALLTPALMLCLLLAMDHLEERLLGPANSARRARPERRLPAVSGPAAHDMPAGNAPADPSSEAPPRAA
jgi:hypothetical protein